MAKKKLQWTKLGEGVLADWRGALDDKYGVRLEFESTGTTWGPWHMRKGETLVSSDTLRAKSLVGEAARAADGEHKGVPHAVLEALESFAARRLVEAALSPAVAEGAPLAAAKAPELRVLLPAFEQLVAGEYVLDLSDSPLATWTVRVEEASSTSAVLSLVEPGPDRPITHGRYSFDADGGTLLGVGEGCTCGRPDTSPGEEHHGVLEALALAEMALTATPWGVEAPVEQSAAPAQPSKDERPRITGLPREQVKGDLLRRWLQVAHELGEGGKLSEAVESLPVPLTQEGRLRKADLLTATYEEDGELDVEEKAFKDGLKRRREDVDKRRQTLVGEIQSRKEYRDVRTVEVVVYPLRAVWRVRTDTHEVVDSRAMDLADQAARVYAEDDSSAPFHSRPRVEAGQAEDEEGEPAAPQGPRPKKKRAASSSGGVSLSLSTEQALDLEPEEQRRRAVPDATSDMTVGAPVKHRCQRARCGHSEADHSGSSGQCMASIRVERDGMPGETCACTAYVPPPSARASKPAGALEKAPEPAAVAATLPEGTGVFLELANDWQAKERATGWWLSHAEGPDNVGPFFAVAGSGGRFFVEQPQDRPDLDEWASSNEHVLNELERALTASGSFARHYLLGDDAPGWMLAVSGPADGPVTLFLVRDAETGPALEWHGRSRRLCELADTDAEREDASRWLDQHTEETSAAESVIKRGDVPELPQPTEGVVLQ